MKKIILSLIIAVCVFVFAHNSQAANSTTCVGSEATTKTCTVTIDATGTECYYVGDAVYHTAIFDLTTGTIAYNWEVAIDMSPTGGESNALLSVNGTADDSAKVTMVTPGYMCVEVSTCTSCGMTVTTVSKKEIY